KYYESVNLEQEVACLMLSSMSPDLQKTLEKFNAYDMMKELKTMFEEQAKQELFKTIKAFHTCKQEEGQSVSSYLLKMKNYLDTFERLGYAMPNELGKMLAELHVMQKLHEKGAKGKAKGNNKLAYAPKTKTPPPPKRDNPTEDSICHHYKKVGHWRRNCSSYHAELKKRKNARLQGYVLDTATRILNIVPTKKVDRTPYEIWHGKAPKLPYLRFWGWDFDEPPIYKAALIDPESDKWLKAMNTKIQSMKDNQVWYLVNLPSNGRTAGCKWLLKNNTDMDGNVHNFKAHLVAKGFIQTYRVDYGETFSPVAYIRAIRILLAIVVFYDYKICQSSYLEKTLKKFRMENSKKGYTSMIENPDYRKSQGAKTPTEVQHMQRVPYALAIEAEYIVATEASMEAVWMGKFIDGLGGVMPSNKRPMEMLCDNVPALAIANDPKILKGVRHF
nr:hypothetical protein [Tanacetum cinerariifolium]